MGLVWIGLSTTRYERAWEHHFPGDRLGVKDQSARAALQHVIDYLSDL